MIENGPFFLQLENITGEFTGEIYNGEFQVKKYLTNRERSDVARLTESWIRGIERNQDEMTFLSTLAHLAFHVTKAPTWWGDKGFDLQDREPVWKLADLLLDLQKPPTKPEAAVPST